MTKKEIDLLVDEFGLTTTEKKTYSDWWGVEVYRAMNNGELPPQKMPEDEDKYIKEYIESLIKFLRSDGVKNMDWDSIPSGNVNDIFTMMELVVTAKMSLYKLLILIYGDQKI